MKFAILTTTYNRPLLLMRAVSSVRTQTHTDYMHIIINDSTLCDYEAVESDIVNDNKILYIKNQANMGKNYSLNIALDYLKNNKFEGYVIYLDDDDWLTEACLLDFNKSIIDNPEVLWFVSNRVLTSGESLTKNTSSRNTINYFIDYLILKRFKGDATHCIDFAKTYSFKDAPSYPKNIKNGEEWYYFLRIAKYCNHFLHIDKIGTLSEGYSPSGLNSSMQKSYWYNTKKLFKEKQSPYILFYLCIRFLSIVFKKNA